MRGRILFMASGALFFALLLASPSRAQLPTKPPPPPPPDTGESSSKNPPPDSTTATPPGVVPEPADDEPPLPSFDILAAQKDIEVGTFYLKKGDYDAAIDRFTEAAKNEPKYAEPWLLLGETYEKKKDIPDAINSYQQYLRLYLHAPTRKKLEDHIAELQSKVPKAPPKPATK